MPHITEVNDSVDAAAIAASAAPAAEPAAVSAPAPAADDAEPRRARLAGPEIVQLPPDPDTDDDDEPDSKPEGEARDDDFLATYPADTEELHLQHLRLHNSSLLPLRLPRFGKSLRRLCLRQNELSSPLPGEVFEGLDALDELDLYDNRLGPRVGDDELGGVKNVT